MINVSVVTYNTEKDELQKVVTCVADSDVVQKIYIVDNSPNDNLRNFATSLSSKITYIYGQGNVGYGVAHNIALQKSIEQNVEYHLVLNPDIVFEKGTLEQLQIFMNENSSVGLAMPKILYPNGENQYLCKLLPTPFDLIFRRFLFFLPYIKKHTEKYELRKMDYSQTHFDIPLLSGCFMLMRTDVLQKTGLFDHRYFMYLEDYDLCRRIVQVAQTAFFPRVSVIHNYEKGSYRNFKLLNYHIASAFKYFNKWGWFLDKERRKINNQALQKLII